MRFGITFLSILPRKPIVIMLLVTSVLFHLGCSQPDQKSLLHKQEVNSIITANTIPKDIEKQHQEPEKKSIHFEKRSEPNVEELKFIKTFSQALPLDSLLNKYDIYFEAITPAKPEQKETIHSDKTQTQKKTKKGLYRIQLITVADFETAQNKKYSLSRILGKPIEVIFDAPFYKLRYGKFSSLQLAQDKLLDTKELGLQGFIIKE